MCDPLKVKLLTFAIDKLILKLIIIHLFAKASRCVFPKIQNTALQENESSSSASENYHFAAAATVGAFSSFSTRAHILTLE